MKSLQSEVKQGQFRPSFCMPYTIPKSVMKKAGKPSRLGDLILCCIEPHDPEFLDQVGQGEFAVFDTVRIQKAYFQIPKEATTPDYITGLISQHFDSPAVRVTNNLWLV